MRKSVVLIVYDSLALSFLVEVVSCCSSKPDQYQDHHWDNNACCYSASYEQQWCLVNWAQHLVYSTILHTLWDKLCASLKHMLDLSIGSC